MPRRAHRQARPRASPASTETACGGRRADGASPHCAPSPIASRRDRLPEHVVAARRSKPRLLAVGRPRRRADLLPARHPGLPAQPTPRTTPRWPRPVPGSSPTTGPGTARPTGTAAGSSPTAWLTSSRSPTRSASIEFAVTGGSGGGPHCLAVAAALPDRVTRAACIVGSRAVRRRSARSGSTAWTRRTSRSSAGRWRARTRSSPSSRREAAEMLTRMAHDPATVLGDFELPEADREILAGRDRQGDDGVDHRVRA